MGQPKPVYLLGETECSIRPNPPTLKVASFNGWKQTTIERNKRPESGGEAANERFGVEMQMRREILKPRMRET